MHSDDDELLARFNRRLARIDNEIPNPPELRSRGAGALVNSRGRRSALGWAPSLLMAAAVLVVAVTAIRLLPERNPTPTAPAVGQTAIPSPTAQPSAQDATLPPATSLLSPDSSAPPLATALPDPTPTTTPTESPSGPPTETPPPLPTDVWRRSQLPSRDAPVRDVIAGGPGFVAVGFRETRSDDCLEWTIEPLVWTSSDGETWTEDSPPSLDGLPLNRLVQTAGTLYATGPDDHPDCASDTGLAIARSSDGVTWERLDHDLPVSGCCPQIMAAGERLIALGYREAGDGYEPAEWTSLDGEHWSPSALPPPMNSFEGLVARPESLGETIIGFEELRRGIWYSHDGGDTWRQSEFAPLYDLVVLDVVAEGGQFVAVASACCTLPNTRAGVVLTSLDGQNWRESSIFDSIPQAVTGIPNGYIAIGSSNWMSRDGVDWRIAPPLPEFDSREYPPTLAVASDVGVVVLNHDIAWFAPSDSFYVDASAETPPAPAMPEMGVRYPVDLFLHCGWPPIHFGLQPWLPEPPFEVDNPAGFGDEDRGWLTQVSDDELVYESRKGTIVTLRPSDEPQPLGGCA